MVAGVRKWPYALQSAIIASGPPLYGPEAVCRRVGLRVREVIPQYLYKYRSVDADSLALLASDKVYLSRLDAFNDPFEMLSFESTLETRLSVDRHGTFAV